MPVSIAPRGIAVLLPAAVVLVALVLRLWWPGGVLLGVVLGVVTVLLAGAAQQRTARRVEVDEDVESALGFPVPRAADRRPVRRAVAVRPVSIAAPTARVAALVDAPEPLPVAFGPDPFAEEPLRGEGGGDLGVRSDLQALKAQLGDDWPDFGRAARLVVETQYASAARLQRELQLPYSRARRLLAGLETEHIVGPATGSLPRQVLLPKERLPEVDRMLAGAGV